MGSISHYIMPLVINSLGGRHTHMQTHTHMHTHRRKHTQAYRRSWTEAILRNPVCTGLRPAHAWFNNSDAHTFMYSCMHKPLPCVASLSANQPVRAWFLIIATVHECLYVYYVCVCMCLPPKLLITSCVI